MNREVNLNLAFTMPPERVVEAAKRLLEHSDPDVRMVAQVFLDQTDGIEKTQQALLRDTGVPPPPRPK